MPQQIFPDGQDLREALRTGDLAFVVQWVQQGGDVARVDRDGSLALRAAVWGHHDVVRYLVSQGSSATHCNIDGHDAVHVAWSRQDYELAERIESGSGDISVAGDFCYWTPFTPAEPAVNVVPTPQSRSESTRTSSNGTGLVVQSIAILLRHLLLLPVYCMFNLLLAFDRGPSGDPQGDAYRAIGMLVISGLAMGVSSLVIAAWLYLQHGWSAALVPFLYPVALWLAFPKT